MDRGSGADPGDVALSKNGFQQIALPMAASDRTVKGHG
jgi:hypothetical protein